MPSNRLPAPLTRFVGRERELDALESLLFERRLVTLVGAGGIGKTRLAVQLANRLSERFQQHVWLVELAPLNDQALVGQAIADAVVAPERADREAAQAIAEVLQDVEALLVLDNCEHLLDACAGIAESLLRQCPRLHVLVTSRQSLSVAGECAWRVPSLADKEAMELLVDRARAAQPRLESTAAMEESLSRICRQLDGIPLALELAGARMSVLSPEQIATRLETHLRVLSGGSRTALPRQRTLEAALDWSVGQLQPMEQSMFRRLAVFSGGWSVEAVESVCTGEDIQPEDAVELLAELVEKSLVQAEPARDRFRLLEPIRAYASEKLRDSDEEPRVRRRHRDYYVRLAQRIADSWQGRQSIDYLDAIERDLDNLRAAVEWCRDADEAEAGLLLLDTFWFYWNIRGHLGEWRERIDALLSLPSGQLPSRMRVRGLNAAGYLALAQADEAATRQLHQQALQLADELGLDAEAATAVRHLGMLAHSRGDLSTARDQVERSLNRALTAQDSAAIYLSQYVLAGVLREQGERAAALALYETSLAAMRAANDIWHSAQVLLFLAHSAMQFGDLDRARATLVEAVDLLRRLGDRRLIAGCVEGFACLAALQGHAERAALLSGAAAAHRESMGAAVDLVTRADTASMLAPARVALGDRGFEASAARGRTLTIDDALAIATAEAARGQDDVLTPREREVAALLARGLSNRSIASQLVISEQTAETHAKRVLAKLGLSSRTQLVARASEFGLTR